MLVAGEVEVLQDRHADWFLAAAETGNLILDSGPQVDTLTALEADHDNLRAALNWTLTTPDERALRFVVALTMFWTTNGHYTEGQTWHRLALAEVPSEPSPLRIRALWGLGHICMWGMELAGGYGVAELQQVAALGKELGEDVAPHSRALVDLGFIQLFLTPEGTDEMMAHAIAAARQAGDRFALASGLWTLAFFWIFDRDRPDRAEPHLTELADIARRTGSPYWSGWHGVCTGVSAWREGRLSAGRAILEGALADGYEIGEVKLELYAAMWLGYVHISLGDYSAAREVAQRQVASYRRSCEPGENWAELQLAIVSLAEGGVEAAHTHLDAALPMVTTYGVPFQIGEHNAALGRLALEEGDLAVARSALAQAQAMADQLGSPWYQAECHQLAGILARTEGDTAGAEDRHHQALALTVAHGLRGVAAETLEALAGLATLGESHAEAARLFGAAASLRTATGQRRWPLYQPGYDADVAHTREGLGAGAFETAWKDGTALTLEDAAAYASRARGERKRPSTGWASLTPTELEVVALVARGLTNAQMGQRLFITTGTVKIHMSHIFTKLGLANRAALAAQATERGFRA